MRLARYALPHTRALASLMLLTLANVGLEAAKPWPVKLIVDSVLGSKDLQAGASWLRGMPGGDSSQGLLAWLTTATIFLFLGGWAIRVALTYLQTGMGIRMVYSLGAEMFDRLQRLSLRFHGRQPSGDLVRRVMSDSSCVRGLVIEVFLPMLTSLLTLTIMFAIMWRMDWSLSLVALAAAPLLAVAIRRFATPMEQRGYEQMEAQGKVMAQAEQTLSALPVVRAFGREEHEAKRFSETFRVSDKAYLRATASQLQFKVTASSVTALGTAAVMAVGGLHVLQGKLTVGGLLVFVAYLSALYSPMETLAYVSYGFATATAGARRVFEILDREPEISDRSAAKTLVTVEGGAHISFENVTSGYDSGRPVLKGVTFEVHPGESVAIVGPTGAGKTTLVSLILRFLDPWEGNVLFDGNDLRDLKLNSLRSNVALVLQEPFLLPLTVSENIAYGRVDAQQDEIVKAAAAANAHEFIQRLPQGYETLLGERGATLSGGERQRLAIARVILKDAPVLILDEPTSSLDSEIEALILEALQRLTKGRTTFIIAHRLSTIRNATSVIVLQDGKIVEAGSHAKLLTSNGVYADLHRKQFGIIPELTDAT